MLVDFKLYKEKNNVGNLLKPFGSKVMTIFITHSYRFTTLIKLRWNEGNNESIYGHTNTSYPVSWPVASQETLQTKNNRGNGCYYYTTPPLMQAT